MKVMANREVRVGGVILVVMLVAGCKKAEPPPATQPAASAQSAPKAGPAVLDVGGEPTEFAVARLDFARDQSSLHMQLYGSDLQKPPQSSFYFDLTLDVEDPESIPGQVWRMNPASDEDVDSSAGIFLGGDAIRLQPKSVEVAFSGVYPNLTVNLKGTFLRDGDEAKSVNANGTFTVLAKEKSGN